MPHPATLPLAELTKQCSFQTLRRGGPGGQHRNKVETAVVARHLPTGISAEANERRSQAENRPRALQRLRVRLALDVRAPVDPTAAPSPLWRSRCAKGKLTVNREHADFPAILSELFDRLHASEYDLPHVAEVMSCSASQLVKFLKQEPVAFAELNQERAVAGLSLLK